MPCRTCLAALAPLALAAGCADLNEPLLYANYETGQYRPADFWCGNRPRGGRTAVCRSNGTDANGPLPARLVEVRGWVVSSPFYNEEEAEFIFNLNLDHGWTPATPADQGIYAVNTLERINEVITPHNVVSFGRGPAMETTAWLGDRAWGGPNALAIHVELNGWGQRSGTSAHRARGWPPPDGWQLSAATGPDNGVTGVAWAFDPWQPPSVAGRSGAIASGDYLRMVGLLWEDTPHENSDENRSGDDASRTLAGKRCWKQGRHDLGNEGRGFSEIHPANYLARLDAPARQDTVFMVVLCDDASLRRKVRPPGPRPSAASVLQFEEYVDAEFSNLGSVTRKRITPRGDFVDVDIITRNRTNGTPGKFKAIYRVYWSE